MSCSEGVYSDNTLRLLVGQIRKNRELLSRNPYLGSPELLLENYTDILYRHIVMKPYFKLIYAIHDGNVYFAAIWDTRRNPQILERQLKEE